MLFLTSTILCSVLVVVLSDCPASQTRLCQPNDTCCPAVEEGEYACCRLPNAECCSDGLHCCPEGTECNPQGGCRQHLTDHVSYTLEKRQGLQADIAKEPKIAFRVNYCSANSYCPDSYTCCVEQSGDHNCCPPNSLCCPVSGHCCPEGSLCDLASGRCRPDLRRQVPLGLHKRQGLMVDNDKNELNVNQCDKQIFCSDDHTCCLKDTGEFGCCPFPKAVCCRDGIHCCPKGDKCLTDIESCIPDKSGWSTGSRSEEPATLYYK